jgi:hypothetical protein
MFNEDEATIVVYSSDLDYYTPIRIDDDMTAKELFSRLLKAKANTKTMSDKNKYVDWQG